MRSSIAIVAVVVLLVVPARAFASEPAQEPRAPLASPPTPSDLFREGLAEYDAEHFLRAIELFTKAYDQTKAPGLLFNIAQAWRLLGECNKAVTSYLKFMADDPSSPDAVRARDWVNKLVPCRERDPEVAPPPAEDLKGRPPVVAPVPAPPAVDVVPSQPAPSKPGRERRSLIVGILAGTSVTCLGTGAYAAWRARDYSTRTTALYAGGGVFNDDAAAIERDGRHARTEAVVLLSAALLTAAVAVTTYFLAR